MSIKTFPLAPLHPRLLVVAFLIAASLALTAQTPPATPPAPPQPSGEIALTISGDPGTPPKYAVPDFIALSADAETVEAAKTIGATLWDDLGFEREFYMIPRDTYASIPAAPSLSDIPFSSWRELGADALVIGSVQKVDEGVKVTMRLFNVRSQQSAFGKEYTGSIANARLYAHTISDEIHQTQRALRGVARTKLAFSSDRDAQRLGGAIELRSVKEVYMADYDGANQRRVTIDKKLNIMPAWSPDARAISFTSYRRGYPDIFISNIYQGTLEWPAKGHGHNFLAGWSSDGRMALMSNRDGNPEIYVMNRDGSEVRRLTNNPANDTTPTWSPTGTQIAFTSDRSGTPQIYIVGVDGTGLRRVTSESYADRATWSPAPFNEIAFSSRSGRGFDIKIFDLASGHTKALTFGEGTNESPAFAPNGRHLAFSSTRKGKSQIFTMTRDGRDIRQVTFTGNNVTPDWSR